MSTREAFHGIGGDLRFSWRALRRSPAFALTVVLTLALCIGATTAIFSVVRGVLLRPLPFRDPDRLVRVWQASPENGVERGDLSTPNLKDWRERFHGFASEGAFFFKQDMTAIDLTGLGQPQRLSAAYVDAGFFPTLGVPAALGRWPTADEFVPGRDRVVLLSDAAFRRLLGGDPKQLGRTLTLGGEPMTVIGVLPPSYPFPGERVDFYLPLSQITEDQVGQGRTSPWLGLVARLGPGMDAHGAQRALDQVAGALAREYPENRAWSRTTVLPLHDAMVGDVRPVLLLVMGAVALILLIACVNIANLMLARAASREHEQAVRVALGASRWHLARQLLTETLLLSLTGGVLGVILAGLALPAILALGASILPRLDAVHLDVGVLAFAAGVSVLTGLLFALAPVVLLPRATQGAVLKSARTVAGGGSRARNTLVVAEVMLAVVLVAGASLAARSLWALMHVELGFDPKGVTVVTYSSSAGGLDGARYHAEVLRRVSELPGVTQAGGAKNLPLENVGEPAHFQVVGQPPPPGGADPEAYVLHTTPGYLEALHIPVLRGEPLRGAPSHDTPLVLLCNETFARRFFGTTDVVGKRIRLYGDEASLQGVVGDVRQGKLREPPTPSLYINQLTNSRSRMNLTVRSSAPPAEVARQVREALTTLNPDQTITRVTTMQQIVDDALAPPELVAASMGVFAGLGLLLGAVGIFGVLAYLVGQRRRELAIRLALGEQPGALLRWVLARGLKLAAVGVAVGLACTLAATRVAGALVYGLSAHDPATLAFVCTLLLGVAALASYLPARRAARVDPAEVLKAE